MIPEEIPALIGSAIDKSLRESELLGNAIKMIREAGYGAYLHLELSVAVTKLDLPSSTVARATWNQSDLDLLKSMNIAPE